MSDNEYLTLFADLDVLLDTRLSTIFSFGKEAINANFNRRYFSRKIDIFETIDPYAYKERYLNRDKKILKNALSTDVKNLMRQFVQRAIENIINTPYQRLPKIIINTYPYILNDQEAAIIVRSITLQTNEKARVELVHMSPADITPNYVKNQLSIMMRYDCLNWLELQSELKNFDLITCPEVSLLGPAMYYEQPNLTHQSKVDPFLAAEKVASPLISLKLLPIDVFCLVVDQATIPP